MTEKAYEVAIFQSLMRLNATVCDWLDLGDYVDWGCEWVVVCVSY